MDLGLSGKVAFVTGASGGIGGPTARLFAAEGARVALTYHRNEAGARKVARQIDERSGHSPLVLPYDLADPASITAAFDTVAAHWGGIDVLVLNASPADGPSREPPSFEDVPVAAWRGQLRTEIEGNFHSVQLALPLLRSRPWGRIVFVSASVVKRGYRGEEAYVATKSALHGLSRTLATELAGEGILVNVVAPGPTVTAKLVRDKLPAELSRSLEGEPPERLKEILDRQMPHLSFSTPQQVANVIAFLGSAANGNVSGTVVDVAGGH